MGIWDRVREAMSSADGPPPPRDHDLPGGLHRIGLSLLVIGVCAALIAALTIPGAAVIGKVTRGVAKKLDHGPTSVQGISFRIAQRSVVYAAGGEVIATLAGVENRTVVALSQVPSITQRAVIAIEDSRFYEHRGVDLSGTIRALLSNVEAGGVREGGSTITQQLVKNLIVGNQKTLDRKIREAQYAVALEREKSKREILELYLNQAYFGEGAYGIGTAAEYYFGKNVGRLSLPESALLAGIIRSPERYDPLRDPKAALLRRNLVLNRMADLGFIGAEAATRATRRRLGAARHPLPKPVEPYFIEFIKEQIQSDPRFGETRPDRARAMLQGGLKIHTTLDLKLQTAARDAVAKILDRPSDPAAALVSIDPATGAVKAMVGGKDFRKLRYNLAVQGKRQAGSSFKPFTMVGALEEGIPPGYSLDTPSPITVRDQAGKPYKVQNYSHKGEGIMDMRRATELSVNSYYVQLITKVGPQKVVDVAHKLGIASDLRPYLSLALGTFSVSPYEMASAYSTLANGGVHCRPYAISSVVDSSGKAVVSSEPTCERTVDPDIAAQADAILQGVIERGTGRRNAKIGRPAGGKTGTTDDYTDAWFSGFTPQFATVVWLGYPSSTKRKLHNIHGYRDVFGGSLPAMTWARYMKVAHDGLPIVRFPAPPPVTKGTVPNVLGRPVSDAKAALQAAGFVAKVEKVPGSLAAGTVSSQSPVAGTELEAGRQVTLTVSDGSKAPSPSPSPSPSPPPSPTPTPT